MTLIELRKWIWDRRHPDAWEVSLNGTQLEGAYTLDQLAEIKHTHAGQEIRVRHAAGLAEADYWMRLSRRPEGVKSGHLADLRKWLWDHHAQDAWWVSFGETLVDHVVSLEEIAEYQNAHGQTPALVLHLSHTHLEEPHWFEIPPPDSVIS